MLKLQPGQKILDVGGGIGGGAFYMAKVNFISDKDLIKSDFIFSFTKVMGDIYVFTFYYTRGDMLSFIYIQIKNNFFCLLFQEFGVKATILDLSSNMTQIGLERAQELGIGPDEVCFEIADATKREYPPELFDVVYSRDTILHIEDKLSLFKKFFVSLFLCFYC